MSMSSKRNLFWDPMRDVMSLQRSVDRLFEDFLAPVASKPERQPHFSPAVDVEESGSHYLISFDLPGISKDELKIEVEDGVLTVSGERKEEKLDERNKRTIERFYGRFQRSFSLPQNVNADDIEADYRDGVLMLAVPKAEAPAPKRITIGERKDGFISKLLGSPQEKKTEKKDAA